MKLKCNIEIIPKLVLNEEFKIQIKKKENKLPIKRTKYRYEMNFYFKKINELQIILTQYNEDVLNKDIQHYLEYKKINLKENEEYILLSNNIKKDSYGFKIIQKWKNYFPNIEYSLETILKEKNKPKQRIKEGPFAFARMEKYQIQKTILKKGSYMRNKNKIN